MRHTGLVATAAFVSVLASLTAGTSTAAPPASAPATSRAAAEKLEAVCPGLATGALTGARVSDLPKGVLVQADTVTVTQAEIEKEIAEAWPVFREQFRKNAFFLAEELVTRRLLLAEAKRHTPPAALAGPMPAGPAGNKPSDTLLINTYLRSITEKVTVPDAEVAAFYERNKELFGGAEFKEVKASIEGYLRDEKRQAAANAHIRAAGARTEILVDRNWAKAQLSLARDNPVDQARWSGRGPTVVAFGAAGCCGPDVTKPLVEELAERLKDRKVQVIYVDAREEEILAGRYGVESVPTFVIFDGSGKETDRRAGLLEPEDIVKLIPGGQPQPAPPQR